MTSKLWQPGLTVPSLVAVTTSPVENVCTQEIVPCPASSTVPLAPLACLRLEISWSVGCIIFSPGGGKEDEEEGDEEAGLEGVGVA